MMRFFLSLLIYSIQLANLSAQKIVDLCYLSGEPSTGFESSIDLYNIWSSDLMEWNGKSWIGSFDHANISIPPPTNEIGCRAIFLGNGVTWTGQGETVAIRLEEPLVSGVQYIFTFTTVSHGEGSDGSFAPHVYTSRISYWEDDTTYLGDIGPVGNIWETTAIEFTASSIQQGHSWVIVHSGLGSSGMVSSFCNTCMLCEQQEVLEDFSENCVGEVLELNAFDQDAVSYEWSDGSIQNTILVTQTGKYGVKVFMENCVKLDTIDIKFYEEPIAKLGQDGNICPGEFLKLDVYSEEASYRWQDNSVNSSFEVTEPGDYWVEVSNLCGLDVDSVRFECEEIIVPNIFSPNGDGFNDFFQPSSTEGVDFIDLQVFNRWGEKIFGQLANAPSWDGQLNGEMCLEGVYFWIASFYDIHGQKRTYRGNVSLIR